MLNPSPAILPWLAFFAPAMSAPTFQNLITLFTGAVLALGRRNVSTGLQVLGRTDGNFSRFHRFLSRAHWSGMQLSRLLLAALVRVFLAPGEPLTIVVDETLERRRARQIAYRGLFRDPVRSTQGRIQYAWGIRWVVLSLLVTMPRVRRRWALPFLVIPLLSEAACERLHRKHRTLVERTAQLLAKVRAWQPQRDLYLVGDGSYAAVSLGEQCQRLTDAGPGAVHLVSRLRLDVVLHDFPVDCPPGKRGPKPKKGPRQRHLHQRLEDPATSWRSCRIDWYGTGSRRLRYQSGVSLWYRPSHAPIPIRWVLVRSAAREAHVIEPGACFSTDVTLTAEEILQRFMERWNIEVTFAEARAHLGFETQREWCPRSVGRSTPCVLGIFSLVALIARSLHPEGLTVRTTAWYQKHEPTFADALATVRAYLWDHVSPAVTEDYTTWPAKTPCRLIPTQVWLQLREAACYAN